MEKGRVVLAVLLVAAGVGLLAYGLFHHSIAVFSGSATATEIPGLEDLPGEVLVLAESERVSEPAVVQEVARGGVTRDESGRIKKTYEGTEAPKACPT